MTDELDLTERDTPQMLSLHPEPGVALTQDLANQHGKATLGNLSVAYGCPQGTRFCLVQYGPDVDPARREEPAYITGFAVRRSKDGTPSYHALIEYLDKFPDAVDMRLPTYLHGTKPPRFFPRKVLDKDGDVVGVERPSHRRHWIILVPETMVRPALKLKA